MAVELEDEEGLLSDAAKEKFDEGIGAALEIREENDVDVGVQACKAPGGKNAAAGVPEHVGVEIVDGSFVEREKIERQNINAVEIA